MEYCFQYVQKWSFHSNPHYFEFFVNEGVARMRYKKHFMDQDDQMYPMCDKEAVDRCPDLQFGYRVFQVNLSISD